MLNQNQVTMSGKPIPVAAPEERGAYFYYDRCAACAVYALPRQAGGPWARP